MALLDNSLLIIIDTININFKRLNNTTLFRKRENNIKNNSNSNKSLKDNEELPC